MQDSPFQGRTCSPAYVGKTEAISGKRESALNVNRVRVTKRAGGENVSVSEYARAASCAGERPMLAALDRSLRAWREKRNPRAAAATANRKKQIETARRARSGR